MTRLLGFPGAHGRDPGRAGPTPPAGDRRRALHRGSASPVPPSAARPARAARTRLSPLPLALGALLAAAPASVFAGPALPRGPALAGDAGPFAPAASPAAFAPNEDGTGRHHAPSLQRTSAGILLGLGAAAWVSRSFEDPEAMARSLDGSPLDGVIDLGDRYGDGLSLGSAAAGAWLLGRAAGNRRLAAAGGDLSRSLLASWAAVWALKLTVNARRPNGGRYSFPSGHTATAFAAGPVISRHFGRTAGGAAYAVAAGTALARMEDRRHYLADVLFGAAIGIVAGREAVGGGLLGRHLEWAPDRIGVRVRF